MSALPQQNDEQALVKYRLQDLFGYGGNKELHGLRYQPEYGAIDRNPDYVWRESLVRNLTMFWVLPKHRACMLIGPTGTGKTTAVEQWHAALNWPLIPMGADEETTVESLFGQYLPNDAGGLDWHDGPLVTAARMGCSVLINEFNAAPPGVTIALNDIAQDGSRITLKQTGEVITPAPGFRIFATVNPPGQGNVRYHGRKPIDPSTRGRFTWIKVLHATPEEEKQMIMRAFQMVGAPLNRVEILADRMVKLALETRKRSIDSCASADALVDTICSRVLCRWAMHWWAMIKQPGAGQESLRTAFTNGCDEDSAAAIHKLAEACGIS